jgi:hypothetical protein
VSEAVSEAEKMHYTCLGLALFRLLHKVEDKQPSLQQYFFFERAQRVEKYNKDLE